MSVMQHMAAANNKWHAAALALPAAPRGFGRRHRVSCCIQPPVGDRGIGEDRLTEISIATDGDGIFGVDMKQLIDDAQQSILHLNTGRTTAFEKLQKVERERDLLAARVAQLKAEHEASMAECDLLRQKAKQFEMSFHVSGRQGKSAGSMKRFKMNRKRFNPPSIWSEILLRIDAMTLTGVLQIEQATSLRKLVWARDAQIADMFFKLADGNDAELSARLLSIISSTRRRSLHIVHICTEMAPVAQPGTASFNISNLCKALRRNGHLVEVILPKYDCMDLSAVDNLREIETDLYIYFGDQWHKNRIWIGTLYGIAVTLLEPFHPGNFFAREEFYNYNDDFERFTYFCKLSLEYLLKLGKQADILHLHNWQTAAVAPMFWEHYAHQDIRLVLTCHDFRYQCLRDPHKLAICGLDPEQLNRPDRLQDDLEPRFINMLKGGIVYSNIVTTVSPIYAADVLTKEHGYDLHVTLNTHKDKFIGIYNGLDDVLWDPALDCALPETYSVEDMAGKSVCKASLRQELGLPMVDDSVPLVGCILFENSEVELKLIRAALECAVGEEAQFVCAVHNNPGLGIRLTGKQIHTDANARLLGVNDDALLHRIVAASDILYSPDMYEPASQSVMIGMRYGAVPVARQVHSITSSIINLDEQQHIILHATGFPFYSTEDSDAITSLHDALTYWKCHPEMWSTLVRNCMSKDLSWDSSCVEAYEAAYWSVHKV
uniref:starch synthase n=1 Tax=Physcomitrium patens TaxID=3218 RepID=A0A7I4AQ84_PHYPA